MYVQLLCVCTPFAVHRECLTSMHAVHRSCPAKLTHLATGVRQVLPPAIADLPSLTVLKLDNNSLSSIPPEIGGLQKLEVRYTVPQCHRTPSY